MLGSPKLPLQFLMPSPIKRPSDLPLSNSPIRTSPSRVPPAEVLVLFGVLPDELFVELDTQPDAGQEFNSPVLDGEDFWVFEVAQQVERSHVVMHLCHTDISTGRNERITAIAYLPTHLTNQEVRRREGDLQRSSESDGAERTMRCESNVVCFGHVGDSSRLGDTSRMRDIRLDNVDTPGFEVRTNILAGEQSFAKLDPPTGKLTPQARVLSSLTAMGMFVLR